MSYSPREVRCNDCGGTDEHPPQHCQDCPQLDHIPEDPKMGKGCQRCGFTGYASGPAYDRNLRIKCPICLTSKKKVQEQGWPSFMNQMAPTPKFPFGRTVMTAAVSKALPTEVALAALVRHGQGDWGSVDTHDAKANDEAMASGGRLLSVYEHEKKRFWVITEGEDEYRVTTVLFPSDY